MVIHSTAQAPVSEIDPPGPRLPLGPDTVSRRVTFEPLGFLGGGRALLLQVGHPLVATGVDQHSDYESHPFARLARTVDVMLKLAFGPPEVSARQQVVLARRHARVRGTSADGVAYAASDPALLLWVWATLFDTQLTVYERLFGALSPLDRARFYDEQKHIAYGCGVPAAVCPRTLADFAAYWDETVAHDLRVTDPARAVARAVLAKQLPGPLGSLSVGPARLATAGLLPPSVRDAYGLHWDDRSERQLELLFATLGLGSRLVPSSLRHLPIELALRATGPLTIPARFGARR